MIFKNTITKLIAAGMILAVLTTSSYRTSYVTAENKNTQTQTQSQSSDNLWDLAIGAKILSIQNTLPEGTPMTNENNKWANSVWPFIGTGCMAFAMYVSDQVYGASSPVTIIKNPSPESIKAGDAVRVDGIHTVVAIAVDEKIIIVCEGNYNGTVHWGRVMSKESLRGHVSYIARRS